MSYNYQKNSGFNHLKGGQIINNSKRLLLLTILFVSVVAFSMLCVTASVASMPQTYTTEDNSIQIDAKYKKASTNQITFNANGGKVGTKKSVAINVKKGAKIKKLPAAPKRKGYIFQGWYTKKSGGTKISVNTKPNKIVTYFAQWTKKTTSRVLTAEEKKLVGDWFNSNYNSITGLYDWRWYIFKNDGTFKYYRADYKSNKTGNYKVSNGKITFTNLVWYNSEEIVGKYPNTVVEYKFVTYSSSDKYKYLSIPLLEYPDLNYLKSGFVFQSS